MDIKKFSFDLEAKTRELHILVQRDIPRVIGVEAKEHFVDSFRQGGFVNRGLQPWPDVKRRDPDSPWYGFEYTGEKRAYYGFSRDAKTGKTHKAKKQKRLNYSENATKRAVLTSRQNRLMNSIANDTTAGQAEVYTTEPHAKLHNEGGEFLVFGKHRATMPARQFMGESEELDRKATDEIINRIDNLFK